MHEAFHRVARQASLLLGSGWTFMCALLLIVGWGISGFIFGYSESWQLFINTFTTITTFLMVILIQNTQNRDAKALHLKLDELIRAGRSARDYLVSLENLSDEELDALAVEFEKIREKSRKK
jgi:low affinity Fe/Cu permease